VEGTPPFNRRVTCTASSRNERSLLAGDSTGSDAASLNTDSLSPMLPAILPTLGFRVTSTTLTRLAGSDVSTFRTVRLDPVVMITRADFPRARLASGAAGVSVPSCCGLVTVKNTRGERGPVELPGVLGCAIPPTRRIGRFGATVVSMASGWSGTSAGTLGSKSSKNVGDSPSDVVGDKRSSHKLAVDKSWVAPTFSPCCTEVGADPSVFTHDFTIFCGESVETPVEGWSGRELVHPIVETAATSKGSQQASLNVPVFSREGLHFV
jgi:hypothetical protein